MGYSAYGEPVNFVPYQRFKVHPEDGATLTHWPLQGDALDSVGPNNATGTWYFQNVSGLDPVLVQAWSVRSSVNNAAGSTNIKSIAAITVACWVSVTLNPLGNLAIIGMRGPGPGAAYNFPWELGYESGIGVRFFWQSGTKTYEGTVSQPIPFGEWTHLIGTRNVGSDTARVYINGVLADEATGLSPWSSGANQNSVEFFSNSLATTMNGQLFSAIVKNTYTDDAAALALYNSTIETVTE